MNEIWKDVPGYEGLYEASNTGQIRNPRKTLKSSTKNSGYKFVVLFIDKKPKCKYVHRLVWEAFNGPIPHGFEVNHIDEDKSNNALENLEIMTHKENCNYGTRNERANATKRHSGGLWKWNKKVAQVGPDFKLIKIHSSLKNASIETGAFISNISACCKNKNKFAKGFHWVLVPPDCQDVEELIRNHFE